MDYRLSVDRKHLLSGLKMFRGPLRKLRGSDTAILGYDGQYFTIEGRGVMVLAQAFGAWPGNARINGSLIAAFVKIPPAGDPIIVTCDGEHVHFGPAKVGCAWQPVSKTLLGLPRQR